MPTVVNGETLQKEYDIVTDMDPRLVTELVRAMMQEGWDIVGPCQVSVSTINHEDTSLNFREHVVFAQTMVRNAWERK